MKIAIATDHNGVEQKLEMIYELTNQGYEMIDLSKDNNPTDDYPDFAFRVTDALRNKDADLGILMCGTGIGMSIAANKVKGVRAAKVSNIDEARLAREHNAANIICLSYKQPVKDLVAMSAIFLATQFSNEERHVRRIKKIIDAENNK